MIRRAFAAAAVAAAAAAESGKVLVDAEFMRHSICSFESASSVDSSAEAAAAAADLREEQRFFTIFPLGQGDLPWHRRRSSAKEEEVVSKKSG